MANSIGNGIRTAFEAIKLVFTHWYSYLITALWAIAVLSFGWLLRFLLNAALSAGRVPGFDTVAADTGAQYIRATNDSLMTNYIFGLSTDWNFAAALIASFCTISASIVFIRSLLDEHEHRPLSWKSIIFCFLKYTAYFAPVFLALRLVTLSLNGIVSIGIPGLVLMMICLMILSALLSFYLVQAVATRKIVVNFSQFSHFVKSNIFNYLGAGFIFIIIKLVLMIPLNHFLMVSPESNITTALTGVSEISIASLVVELFVSLFFCAAITLMYLRTPKESHDQFNR